MRDRTVDTSNDNAVADTIDRANQDAADVYAQWRGVSIDWSDVRGALMSHWDDASIPEEYIDLVARELLRIHAERGE